MSEVETIKLKYLAQVNPTQLADSTSPEFEFNYIDIGSVEAGRGITGTTRYQFQDAPTRARRIVREGDSIVSTVRTYLGAIAKVGRVHDGDICSTGFAVLRPDTRSIDADYFGFAVSSPEFVDQVVSRSVGVSYPGTNAHEVANCSIPVPSIESQREIAARLTRETEAVDSLIQRANEMVALRRSLHWSRFAPELTASGGLNGSIRLLHTLDGPPANGVWGETPGEDAVDVACVRVADFDRAALSVRSSPTMRSIRTDQARRLALQRGDLLLEKSGGGEKTPVGFVVMNDLPSDSISVTSNFIGRMRCRAGFDPEFVVHAFGALYATGRNVPHVRQVTGIQNLDVFGYLCERVPRLELDEQTALAARAREGLREVVIFEESMEEAVRNLSAYRKSLVSEAIWGNTRSPFDAQSGTQEAIAV